MKLTPGKNCWHVEKAERFRCVQDGAEFFQLFRQAVLKARHSIYILGWDIAAGVDLVPGANGEQEPTRLAELLDFVVRRRRRLHCYVLVWDYAALYALERDPFSRWKLGWRTHRRVRFRFDPVHPYGASHHQKVVVVDDKLAFSGGLDLTGHRWDTDEHLAEHPLRATQMGRPYGPFHDVQAMVEGPVAARLGELARERWFRRTGKRPPRTEPATESLWPDDVEPDFTDVDVAIARTEPGFRHAPAVRECEALFLDSIASARHTIYVENQYFTSRRIAEALAARLAEPDGPEIVVVGPRECSGWLEQKTMGALRETVHALLRAADAHGRLRIYCAVASREREVCTFIHSKIMVIDDQLLRIGSANLSNRSMGMDTECDVALIGTDANVRRGITRVRDRLIAEHVSVTAEEITRAVERTGSLCAALDGLPDADHAFVPIEPPENPTEVAETFRMAADPSEPMLITRTLDHLLPEFEADERRRGRFLLPAAALLGAVYFAWRASGHVRQEIVSTLQPVIHGAPWDAGLTFAVLAVFALGGIAFVPTELLVLGTVVLLGPLHGGVLALVGVLGSAAVGYSIGRAIGLQRLVPWVGSRAYRLWRELRVRGAASVALLRLAPVTSATTVHLLSGAARVSNRDYWLGTLIGIAPGFVALCGLGTLLRRMILDPHPTNAVLTVLAAVVLAAIALRARRTLLLRRFGPATQDQLERAEYG